MFVLWLHSAGFMDTSYQVDTPNRVFAPLADAHQCVMTPGRCSSLCTGNTGCTWLSSVHSMGTSGFTSACLKFLDNCAPLVRLLTKDNGLEADRVEKTRDRLKRAFIVPVHHKDFDLTPRFYLIEQGRGRWFF